MSTTTTTADKRTDSALDHLDYGAKTARRVTWEAYEFTITARHRVAVTNASYGYLKDDHTYTVTVEVVDGVALPAECTCPADQHHAPDCKHKVALASIGGRIILDAAINKNSCIAGLATCSGPNSDAFPCFECYSIWE